MGSTASSTSAAADVRNPGFLSVRPQTRAVSAVLMLIGVIAFALALKVDARRAWFAFLMSHYYFMSLAIGGLFFAAVQWITGAMWSAPVRRLAESFTSYLPIALVSFAALYFGMHDLYHWSDPAHVKGDILLEGKASYLSVGFFMVRNLIAIAAWIWFARTMVGNSVAQDSDRGNMKWTHANRRWVPAFLLIFAITYTMGAFDQLMSLEPHWFSTMYGVYCFAGLFYSTLALIAILTVTLKRRGLLAGIVNANHLHDLGKFMFAFTVFWAYIGFSQFMLIWYANLPEETPYYLMRAQGGWLGVSIFLLVGKFLTPFVFLLPRDQKRNETNLVAVGVFMLFAQWVDLLWLTQPNFSPNGPVVGWIELGVTAGFAGAFSWMVSRFLATRNVVAIGDPRLAESVHHHHQ